MSLRRRIEDLESVAGAGEPEADVVFFHKDGERIEMTPEEWREYERAHPDLEVISITEQPCAEAQDSVLEEEE